MPDLFEIPQSATALGATWDTELICQVGGKILAAEAKLCAASVILAPTVNIQRVSSRLRYLTLVLEAEFIVSRHWVDV